MSCHSHLTIFLIFVKEEKLGKFLLNKIEICDKLSGDNTLVIFQLGETFEMKFL